MPKTEKEWFYDSDFWEQFAPIMFDESRWAEVPAVADGIIRLAHLDQGRANDEIKILDLCCGFGRIAAELARRGFSVTGVDITESYLNAAKEDASYENLKIEYIQADARNFSRLEYFDLALNLYTSLGYFEKQEDDFLVVKNAYSSLKKDGLFIIELLGKEIAVRDFTKGEQFERAGFLVQTEYEPLASWTYLKNSWTLIKDGFKTKKTFIQRLYSDSDLRAMLLEAGFRNIEVYGDWDKSPYDKRAANLIVTGRKPTR